MPQFPVTMVVTPVFSEDSAICAGSSAWVRSE